MQSVYQSGVSDAPPSPPAGGSVGFPRPGDPISGTPATLPGAYWHYMVTTEILNVITAGGLTPSATTLTQLRDAIAQMIADGSADLPATATVAEMIAGVGSALRMLSPALVKAAVLAHAPVPLLSREYISDEQQPAPGTTLTFTHDLGVKPRLIRIVRKCVVADGIFVAGDELELIPEIGFVGHGFGAYCLSDATSIRLKFGYDGVFCILTANNALAATPSSWVVRVEAYA